MDIGLPREKTGELARFAEPVIDEQKINRNAIA